MFGCRLLSWPRIRAAAFVRSALSALLLVALPALAAAQNGTVTGTVTNAATAAPLVGRSVTFCTATTNTTCASSNTDASGTYSISLAAGSYVAFTSTFNTLGFINEIYDNVPCPGLCSSATALTSGAPIVVTSGGTTSGKNFALDPGGSVTGTVTDAATGAPIQGVSVALRTLVGTSNLGAGTISTGAAGTFTIQGLPAGVYYAIATASGVGYTNEIYDNILCPGSCNSGTAVASGAPIAVTAGVPTPGINFALDPGGRIAGTVVSTQGGTPLQNVGIQVTTRIGLTVTTVANGATNAAGAYNIGGLPAGTYYLNTSTNLALNEIYDNIPCPTGCNTTVAVTTGAPVSVTSGATASGKDFQLDPGGTVSGTVTDALTALGVANVGVAIYVQSGSSALVASTAFTNSAGVYSAAGLPTGTYFAAASPPAGYAREVFGGALCPINCQNADILAGTPIPVVSGATSAGRNFSLDAAGTITGVVTNATTGQPIANASVAVTPATGSSFGFTTNASGVYTMSGLAPGAYRIWTFSGQYQNKVYNNIACPNGGCGASFVAANGTPVTVTGGATTSAINFAIDTLQSAPGAPFSLTASGTGGTLQISWAAPTSGGIATSYVLEAGLSPGTTLGTLPAATTSLTIPGVPSGTFYLRVRAVNAFGTGPASTEFKLVVGGPGGGTTPDPPTNLVAWMSGGRLTMTWTAPVAGLTPTSYVLEAGSAVGLSNLAVAELSTRSFTFDPIPGGFFFLRVRSKAGGVVSVPTGDVMINVGNVPAPPSPPQTFNISLSGSTATLNWTGPAVGTATSYIIEAGTASGLADLGSVNTGTTATTLSVPGVPPGTFYLRVRAVNAQGASPASIERVLTVP